MSPKPGQAVSVAASCRPPDAQTAQRYRDRGQWRGRTFVQDFLEAVDRDRGKVAVVAHGATLTYGELGELVDRCAAALIDLGVGHQDVVSLQLPNGWEVAVMCLAVLRAGAVPNPLPVILRRRELEYMLDHARTKVFVVPSRFRGFDHAELARSLAEALPHLDHVVVTDGPAERPARHLHHDLLAHRWEEVGPLARELEHRSIGPADIALLLYTSGTTGVPKGALHSHDTLWSAGRALPEAIGLREDDVAFMASTIGHLTGFYWGMLLPLSMGQTVVYQDVWDAEAALDLFATEAVTWTLSATPFAIDLVKSQRARARPLDAFRAFVCGGAPIPEAVAREVASVLGVDLVALWGMTEVGICTMHAAGAPIDVLASSDGFIVEHMDVRIVDEGRLQVRGPSVCLGYLGRPDLYRDAITEDGWFETGDLGRRGPDGGIRITGRSKDIIIRGGENLPVAEIESTLFSHPAVEEVAVVPYPDERLGERSCAVIVAGEPAPSLAELTAFLREQGMAKQYWPERLELVRAMPRTPAGKVQKFVLREWVAAPEMPR